MADLNATSASLLGFLHTGPMTGWDLAQVAEVVIGEFWSLTRSQVYRELSRMAEQGLVAPGPPGKREAVRYELTEAGRAAFRAWAAEVPGDASIRMPLLLAVVLGRHQDPAQLADHLREHRRRHAARLATYEEHAAAADAAAEADPWSRATLEFGLRYERMVLEWFAALPELLPALALDEGDRGR